MRKLRNLSMKSWSPRSGDRWRPTPCASFPPRVMRRWAVGGAHLGGSGGAGDEQAGAQLPPSRTIARNLHAMVKRRKRNALRSTTPTYVFGINTRNRQKPQ